MHKRTRLQARLAEQVVRVEAERRQEAARVAAGPWDWAPSRWRLLKPGCGCGTYVVSPLGLAPAGLSGEVWLPSQWHLRNAAQAAEARERQGNWHGQRDRERAVGNPAAFFDQAARATEVALRQAANVTAAIAMSIKASAPAFSDDIEFPRRLAAAEAAAAAAAAAAEAAAQAVVPW